MTTQGNALGFTLRTNPYTARAALPCGSAARAEGREGRYQAEVVSV
jgi:hypothetical protein